MTRDQFIARWGSEYMGTSGPLPLHQALVEDVDALLREEHQRQEGEAVSAYRKALDRIAKLEAALDELHLAAARREAIIAELRRNNEVMMGERQMLHDATQRHAKTAHEAEQLLVDLATFLKSSRFITVPGVNDELELTRQSIVGRIDSALEGIAQALEAARRGT